MSYEFPWQEDKEGEFLVLRTDSGRHVIRQTNTDIYTFPDYVEGNHIFHELYAADDEVNMGFRMFKPDLDEPLGDGTYDALVSDMTQRYFTEIISDEMSDYDRRAFISKFGHEPERVDTIGRIVDLAMLHLDSEAEYYLGHEWTA